MKRIFIIIIIAVIQSCNNDAKRKVVGESLFQREMNADFKDASKSPLTKKDLKNFKGLSFFKIDDKYRVTAKIVKTPDAPTFNFPTTTDRVAIYEKYGVISFTIDKQSFELSIYKDVNPELTYENNLFLPFFDKTNGKISYEGGRFIDVLATDESKAGTIVIDFNKAYNPYCAYSDRYSCPITPRDNYLDIEVEAGVMAYKKQ